MSDDVAKTSLSCIPPGLTQAESDFVYNVEVLGLPAKKAAQLAGYTGSVIAQHLMQARETVRNEMRGSLKVTKEDATAGIKDAIERAKLLAEPMTEIAGWDRLIKLHGLDSPVQHNINLHATVEVLRDQVRSMSDADLVRMLGAGNVIDVDFYEVKTDDQ
jgi:hypothetical protein